jgi:putative PIG3 family NAD(P)H quinone oxidoreductase
MRAVVYTGAGDTGVIQLREVPTPEPDAGQMRVRVHASGLNRADVYQRRGHYPAPPGWPADIPGIEYAGEVDLPGEGVTRWKKGDHVMGLVGGGAQAEFVVVHQDEAIAMPKGMSFTDAAAIPEAFLTAWDALVTRGRLQPGERVLIHAVGSGVGTAAIQLAKLLGAVTLGTSRQASKLERCREFGLDKGIDTSAGSFAELLPEPVNVILDVLGGGALADNLAVLAPRGRLVVLGHLKGARAEASLDPLLRKRLEIIGTVMRTRPLAERVVLVREFTERVLPGFERADKADKADGADSRAAESPSRRAAPLRPVVGATYPMTAIAEAHGVMERDETFGKVVLVW